MDLKSIQIVTLAVIALLEAIIIVREDTRYRRMEAKAKEALNGWGNLLKEYVELKLKVLSLEKKYGFRKSPLQPSDITKTT